MSTGFSRNLLVHKKRQVKRIDSSNNSDLGFVAVAHHICVEVFARIDQIAAGIKITHMSSRARGKVLSRWATKPFSRARDDTEGPKTEAGYFKGLAPIAPLKSGS